MTLERGADEELLGQALGSLAQDPEEELPCISDASFWTMPGNAQGCPLTLHLGSLLTGLGSLGGCQGLNLHWPHIRQSSAIQCVSEYRDRPVISGGALRTEAGRGEACRGQSEETHLQPGSDQP